MNILRAVKGMNDLFIEELSTWQKIEKTTHEIFMAYGFGEIRTPILEDLSLFVRGVGEGTDIVEKEMYTLEDRDGKLLCLRPENTAGVVRALVENNKLAGEAEVKAYYMGPMFRRERPQRGRLRQFYQIGAESFGVSEPSVDVEVIAMLHDLLRALGLKNLTLAINTLGLPEERQGYVRALFEFFSSHVEELCEDCQRRLHKNTMRILDCKKPGCSALAQKAPPIVDYLSDASREHFYEVQAGLTQLSIPFVVVPRLVRGLDYYTRTVFEMLAESGLGSQNAVAAGGRYDGLVKNLGGDDVPGFGFAAGIERIVLMLEEQGATEKVRSPEIVLVYADAEGKKQAQTLVHALRQKRIAADFDHKGRSLKAQMRRADRLNAKTVMVLGSREVAEQAAQLKRLSSGQTEPVKLDVSDIARALSQGE
jgi:histidyl-tRNA synthetase